MSVAELQARIESLSADILRQKEVLRTLELSKCAAQRELNAIRDPVARLPLEISSEIFIQCLSTRPRPGALYAPMILASICRSWADIALSTPSLWAAIDADKPISDLASLLDIWLSRAGSHTLSISLPTNLTGNITAVVARHAHQLQVLTIYHPHDQDDNSFSTATTFSMDTMTLARKKSLSFPVYASSSSEHTRITAATAFCGTSPYPVFRPSSSPYETSGFKIFYNF
ncbi:hypothetical protein B0H17DRAFT_1077007 [Mycena rosella]|uniref:F-box domain-containing protein n=1 Tax=Mycena rosella TaxID=1033263 RepID=A0AAD7GBY7_MYCRO|nr:hypothetical protein B0H17DRAFT_1077007 [Mycena rosella]